MNNERIFLAIGNLSDDLVADAEITEPPAQKAILR